MNMNRVTASSRVSGRATWAIVASLIVVLLAVGGCGDDDREQQGDGGTSAAELPRDAFGLLPNDAQEFAVIDVAQVLAGDAPSDFRDRFEDRWSDPLLESGVEIDDVSVMVMWDVEGSDLVIVQGDMDFNEVREELDAAGFEEDEYRGFELWEGGRTSLASSVALMEDGGYVVLGSGTGEMAKDVLRRLSRGSGLVGHADESVVGELLAGVSVGWYVRVEVGEECGGIEVHRCEGVIWTTGVSEGYDVASAWGYLFRDERSAGAAVEELEDLFKEADAYEVEDVVADGRMVVARGSIDEDEWGSDAWRWVSAAVRETTATAQQRTPAPAPPQPRRSIQVPVLSPADSRNVVDTPRLQTVKSRGKVICASRNDVPGFGYLSDSGNNIGFDIDLCRAVAAAVLGDANAIEIRLITAAERGPTIQSGEVDLLVRTITWTTSRDALWGNYAQTMFYEGQGFMVRKDLGINSALELKDATVCVTQGTTTELNLQNFSNQNGLDISPRTFEDTDAVVVAYEEGQCDAFTNDRSQLAALSTALADKDAHTILPETISEKPLGPVVPHGDDQWFDIVKTVMGILIYAEAYGVGQANVPSSKTGDSKVDRLFGLEGSFGQESLGISETAAQSVIRAVGNYGEIYARNLGPSGINLPRKDGDRNALWANAPCKDCPKGGQIYAAPLR